MFSQPLALPFLNLNWGEAKAALKKALNQNKILTQDHLSHFSFALYLYFAQCHTLILQPQVDKLIQLTGHYILPCLLAQFRHPLVLVPGIQGLLWAPAPALPRVLNPATGTGFPTGAR